MELLPPSTSRPVAGPPHAAAAAAPGPAMATQELVSPFSAVSGSDGTGNGHDSLMSAPLLPPPFAGHPRGNTAASGGQHAGQADRKAGVADGILQLTSDTVSPRNRQSLAAFRKLSVSEHAR